MTWPAAMMILVSDELIVHVGLSAPCGQRVSTAGFVPSAEFRQIVEYMQVGGRSIMERFEGLPAKIIVDSLEQTNFN